MGEGILQVRMSALFGAKNFGFFEIYGVSERIKGREVEPVWTFYGQGERGSQFFTILCRRLFCTNPYLTVGVAVRCASAMRWIGEDQWRSQDFWMGLGFGGVWRRNPQLPEAIGGQETSPQEARVYGNGAPALSISWLRHWWWLYHTVTRGSFIILFGKLYYKQRLQNIACRYRLKILI